MIRLEYPWDPTGRHTPEIALVIEVESGEVTGGEETEEAVIVTVGLVFHEQIETVEEVLVVEEIVEVEHAGQVETVEEVVVETAEAVSAMEEGAPLRLRHHVIRTLSKRPLVQSNIGSRRNHLSNAKQKRNGSQMEES